jgi:hypothetical protein
MRDIRIEAMYPPIRSEVESIISEAAKIGAIPFSLYRSLPAQKIEYLKVPRVTDARPGFSYHNYGLAMDMVFTDEHGEPSWADRFDWKALGAIYRAHGWEWGGDWPDPYIHDLPHGQRSFDIAVQRLYIVYARTWRLADVWAWLNAKRT